MKPSAALLLLEQQLAIHGLKQRGWEGHLDRARKRFGLCHFHKKLISISRPLSELNDEVEVRDTILHEIAHALAFEQYGENCGHDHRWKEICLQIGARPERCYSSQEVKQPPARWILCHKVTGEVLHHYARRPRTDLTKLYIKGRKKETLGQLEVRPAL